MPSDNEIVSVHVDVLEGQEETVDDLFQRSKQQRQSRDVGASGELASLVAQITKMDLDRTRFMLVDLARTRMAKIENHALHNKTMVDRMTEEEVSYLRQYEELVEKHYQRTVLNHMPAEAWRRLDDPEMIDSPDLEQFVFCRALEPIEIDVSSEPNVLNEGENENDEDEDDYGHSLQAHPAGACLIVMYKKVRDLVVEGKVELLM
jgi:GINS complex subunit 4